MRRRILALPLVVSAITVALAGCAGTNTTAPVAASTSSTSAAVVTPRLSSVDNFRDLAGPDGGYRTTDGKHIRSGVIYRSNALTPSDADLAALDALHLSAVYDLRTTAEVTTKPDRVPAGAKYARFDILGDHSATAAVDIGSLTTQSATQLLVKANRDFVTDSQQRREFAALLTAIATTDGPQLIHCTAGKDRTGWASAVLLTIASVPHDEVMSNYLLTNDYSKKSIAAVAQQITDTKGVAAGDGVRVALGVPAQALQAGLDQVAATYGSFENYVRAGLGLSDPIVAELKAKLTV